MRQFNVKLLCCIGLVLSIGIVIGCGSGTDLLDENGQRYRVLSVSFSDGDEDDIMTIDVARTECDDNITILDDGGTPADGTDDVLGYDDLESYTDVLADIRIAVSEDAPGISMVGYTIEYIPELSQTGVGLALPSNLDTISDQGNYGIDIASGTSSTFTLTCLSTGTKAEFSNKEGWIYATIPVDENSDGTFDYHVPAWTPGAIAPARYTIRFTLHFEDEYLEDRTIVVERTIYFNNYQRCS